MRFLLDENMPLSTLEILKEKGYSAEHVRQTSLVGSPDIIIAEYAKRQNLILITKDLEFGSMLFYPAGTHYGLIVLRLPSYFKARQINNVLKDFIDKIDISELANSCTILQVGRYRKRKI